MGRDIGRIGLCCYINNFIVYKVYIYQVYLIKLEYNEIIGIFKILF